MPTSSSVHYANIAFVAVSTLTGKVVNKDDPNTTIADVMNTEHQHRIVYDPDIPNSANSPSIKDYIQLEANAGFKVSHIDQTRIITYSI